MDSSGNSDRPLLPIRSDTASGFWHGCSLRLVLIGAVVLSLAFAGSGAAYFYAASGTSKGAEALHAEAADLSTTTPRHIVNALAIEDAVPAEGKFIAADLVEMTLTLYEDGKPVEKFPIQTKGKVGSPFETPSGFYQILTKETNHLSSIGNVYMPYSMQFYGNYFIHGWPYYPDGTPVATSYSGGCIRLNTEDAQKVFEFADKGTRLFVYDANPGPHPSPISLDPIPAPPISAQSYLVADIDTGRVYLDRNPSQQWPIASVTKLMTALVANETISFERNIPITSGDLEYPQVATSTTPESVVVGNLFYPLLMESNNAVANTLAGSYGRNGFVAWMNSTARSLDMASTTFKDASGADAGNISTVDDLFRLTTYLANKKSFVFRVSRTPSYTLRTASGDEFSIRNFNIFSDDPAFIGGKVGQTTAAGETMVSAFSLPTPAGTHRIAIIVLQSKDYTTDTRALLAWFKQASAGRSAAAETQQACVSCAAASSTDYRVIEP